MLGLLRKHKYFRSHDLKPSYDVVLIGGGAHSHGDRVLPGQAPHRAQDRGAREELHGRRRLGPQHHHHPLQLPDGRGVAVLRGQRQAVREPVAGARLQHAVQPARAPDAGPLRPLAEHDDGAGRGEPAGRRRLPRRLSGRGQGAVPAAGHLRPPDVPDPGRALPPAGRRHPPRRGGLGLRQGGGQDGRRDPPLHRGGGDRRRGRQGDRRPARTAAGSPAAPSSRAWPAGARWCARWPGSRCPSPPTSCRPA